MTPQEEQERFRYLQLKMKAAQPAPAEQSLPAQAVEAVSTETPDKSTFMRSLAEGFVPPGVGFKNGMPAVDLESAKRFFSPGFGKYGPNAALETAGEMTAAPMHKILGNRESDLMALPASQRNPKTTAAVWTIPYAIAHGFAEMQKPSALAPALGMEALGMGLSEMGKPVVEQYAKTVHRVPKGATARAIENPAIMKEDFVNPSRLDSIASGFKTALDSAKKAVNDSYERYFAKIKSGKRPGTADPTPIDNAIAKGGEKLGLKTDKEGSFIPGKGTSTQASPAEIAELNELKAKFAEDLKGTKTRKLTADKLHNQRKYIDSKIDYKGRSNLYNKTLENIRHVIDRVVRKNYAPVKDMDAEYVNVNRAAKAIKTRTGIKPGNQDISSVELEKINRLSKTLEIPGNEVIGRELEQRVGGIGGGKAVTELRDVAASSAFNRAIDTNSPLLYKMSAAASRIATKQAIHALHFLPGLTGAGALTPLAAAASTLVKKKKKK